MIQEQIQEIRYLVGEAWKGAYNPTTVYGNANVVQDTEGLSVYRSLKPGNSGHPLTDQQWWFKIIDLSSIKALYDQMVEGNNTMAEHELDRVAAEQGRVSAEQSRVNAENARIYNENQRINDETTRVRAEQDRVTQENQRISQEQGRVGAEQQRVTKEQQRVNQEASRVAAETQRQLNENDRQSVFAEDHAVAVADHQQAEQDHTRAESDHETAVSDHGQMTDLVERADADHVQAGNDHTRAESDHSTAASDHTQAGQDHTTAAADHTQAGNDHTRAESDHTRAESDHAAVEVYVDSLGVFDLSKHNAVGGVLATYADLSAALTALNALDSKYKYGGMSFKFVQSSDNKYVQYRLMATSFSINEDDWQGVDNEPTADSDNLVKSGGVENILEDVVGRNDEYSFVSSSYAPSFPLYVKTGSKVIIELVSVTGTTFIALRYNNGTSIVSLDVVTEAGQVRTFIATENWVSLNPLKNAGGEYSLKVTVLYKGALNDISEFPVMMGDRLITTGGVYGNINSVSMLLGGILNTWEQGIVDTNNPMAVINYDTRIVSRFNIAFPNCILCYEIPVGYNISFVSWDGESSTITDDSGWLPTLKGRIKVQNKYVCITIKKNDSSSITPIGAPLVKIWGSADNNVKAEISKNIPLRTITLNGKGTTIVQEFFYGLEKNTTYRIKVFKKQWTMPSMASYYAKLVIGYLNNNNEQVDIVTRYVESDIADYYEINIPSTLSEYGVGFIAIRANEGEELVFNVTQIDGSIPVLVNSRIFHSCKQAWTDKNNIYESWPNGGVIADGDQIVLIYNSSSAHVATDLVSDVIMRKKTTLGDWDEKKIVLEHTANVGYGNPSCCMLPNGDYFVIAAILTAETVSAQRMAFKMIKSSDKGETWTDMGNVQVGGVDVLDECMMDLFRTSTGKLISFVGGTVNSKYIASDDGGETWRFVGDALSNCLEACFYERDNGEILSILRRNNSDPALIKLNAELTEYEVLYTFGTFKFPAYYNPSSIIKLQNGELYLLGGSRRKDSDNHFLLYEAIVTEDELLANNFSSRVILKAKASNLMDWGYAQAVIAEDGTIYGYFYDSEGTFGTTQIYEMLGC